MKLKPVLFFLFGTVLLLLTSCDDIIIPPSIEPCDYTQKEDVVVTDIALKAPSSKMSSFYYGQVPSDKTFRSLTHALWPGNFKSDKNSAKISGTLTSSGKTCTGNKGFAYKANSSRIGGYYLNLDLPKGVNFIGNVTMLIRSDDYKTKDPNIVEYVLWSGSGNDPYFNGINGNIIGARKTYRPSSAKIPIASIGEYGCYYKNGQKICQ